MKKQSLFTGLFVLMLLFAFSRVKAEFINEHYDSVFLNHAGAQNQCPYEMWYKDVRFTFQAEDSCGFSIDTIGNVFLNGASLSMDFSNKQNLKFDGIYMQAFENFSYDFTIRGYSDGIFVYDTIFNENEPYINLYDLYSYNIDSISLYASNLKIDLEMYTMEISYKTCFYPNEGGEFCPGKKIQFEYPFGGHDKLKWDFGDGVVAYGNYNEHAYSSDGVYDVKLYTWHFGLIDSIVQTITVGNTATPQFDIHPTGPPEACVNDDVEFHINSREHFSQYIWDFGDGDSSFIREPVHAYSDTGIYNVSLTVKNSCGNSNTQQLTFKVEDSENLDASFHYWHPDSYICPGTPVHFQANTFGTFRWSFGDGATSTLRKPVNYYADTGMYEVKLVASNGCGLRDTISKEIFVEYNVGSLPETPGFYFENINYDYYDNDYIDTITVCPGEKVFVRNDYVDDNLSYSWDFGDGGKAFGKAVSHIYSSIDTFEIRLYARNNCGGTSYVSKWVIVDNTIEPYTSLSVAPYKLCPGEKVYFWDDENHDKETLKYKYSIDFGDGNSKLNFNGIDTSAKVEVLATHTYNTEGTYPFTFSIENLCGNTIALSDSIIVENNTMNKPFYYHNNSTQPDGPPGGFFQDWSISKDRAQEHEFIIPVYWSGWQQGWDSTFYIFFWYDELDPSGDEDPGAPNGYVKFETNGSMPMNDTVRAYVPLNHMYPPEVGFGAVWYCEDIEIGGEEIIEPTVYGMPMIDTNSINSFEMQPGGTTYIIDSTGGSPINIDPTTTYSGICSPVYKVAGDYASNTALNEIAFLELENDSNYYMEYKLTNEWGGLYVSEGDYFLSLSADTIAFAGSGECYESDTGKYTLTMVGDTSVMFNLISDYCKQRKSFLDGRTFKLRKDIDRDRRNQIIACPGDNVKFTIVGGETYEWHFGDGSPVNTNQIAFHSYANAGDYNAWVVATNACGRTDTIRTLVKVKDNALPDRILDNIWTENDYIARSEPVKFRIADQRMAFTGWDYDWSFGDGSKSQAMSPLHTFNETGEHLVKVKVTNGCGVSEFSTNIYIERSGNRCDSIIDAKFASVLVDTVNLKVQFEDRSFGDISSYYWNFGDGTSSTDSLPPLHTYKYEGFYDVCLSVFYPGMNCSDMFCEKVKVGAPECEAAFEYTINNSQNKIFMEDLSSHATEWHWNFDDGSHSYNQNPVHTYAKPGIYEICLNVKNDLGCVSNRCEVVQIGYFDSTKLISDFTYSLDADTATKVHFYENITGKVTGGHWDFGDGTTANEPNPSHTFAKEGIYNVCVVAHNSDMGTTSEKCKEIVLGQSVCKADFIYHIDSATNEVGFYDRSSGAVSAWYWDFNDGNWSDSMNAVNVYTKPGTYTVCLHTYDSAADCTSEKCKDIIISSLDEKGLVADFSYFTLLDSGIVDFTDQSKGNPTSWYWTFGDGMIAEAQSPRHNYTNEGLYNVCLNIFDNITGNRSKKCKEVIYGPSACNIQAEFSYFIDNAKKTIKMQDHSVGSVNSWFWNFGDGYTASTQNPQHTYDSAGYYLISLSVKDSNSGCIDYYADFIQVGEGNCKADFDYTVNTQTRNVQFIDQSKGNVSNRFWLFGDGLYSIANSDSIDHMYQQNGMYNVRLTVSDMLCMDVYEQEVQIGEVLCNAGFEVYVDQSANTVYLTNKVMGQHTSLYWVFGDGTVSTQPNPVHTFKQPGYYKIGLNTYNNINGCMDYHEEIVLVNEMGNDCEADFIYIVDNANKTVTFKNKSMPQSGLAYSWNFGDGSSSTVKDPIHAYATGGYYNVCLRVIKPNGIENMTCKYLKVDPGTTDDCFADFAYNIVDTETREVSFVDKSYGAGGNWSWDFGDSTAVVTDSIISHTYADDGLYKVKLTINNSNTGCKSKHYKLVNVNAGDSLIAGFGYDLSDTTLKATGYPVDFVGISHGDAAKLKWDFNNDGICDDSTSTTPTYVYQTPGTHTACLEVWDPVTGDYDKTCEEVKVGEDIGIVNMKEDVHATLQNYPNPVMQGVSNIQYYLPDASSIELSVYSTDGTKVETILNTQKSAGNHSLIWNCKSVGSGVYYLQLKTDAGNVTNKMIIK